MTAHAKAVKAWNVLLQLSGGDEQVFAALVDRFARGCVMNGEPEPVLVARYLRLRIAARGTEPIARQWQVQA